MSFADEEEFASWLNRDDWLKQVSDQAVFDALADFPLTLLEGRDMAWLATAVRRSLAITMRHVEDGPDRTSNYEIRTELGRLAELAESTWLELFECNQAADSRLWDHAWQYWSGEGGTAFGSSGVIGEPSEYRRFKAAIAELDWLAGFLRSAAEATPSQPGPWRQSEGKRIRVERAQYLATIFEAAFGRRVSANNYPNDARHRAPTPFMDFYSRMVTLAFGARETSNLAEVVKAACQRHRQQPAQFAEGVIPGL